MANSVNLTKKSIAHSLFPISYLLNMGDKIAGIGER